jgi:polysaccharide export outer membrane protein
MRLTTLFVILGMSLGLSFAAHAGQKADDAAVRAYGDSEFRLGPEDVLDISVYQELELSRIVPIRPDGKISIPLVGEMVASGKTATELQKEITMKYTQFIADPAVTVVVKEVNSPKVSVLGEVKNPGMYKIKDRATLLDAIALAGGLTEYAKKDKIMIIRVEPSGEQRRLKVNLDDQIKGRRTDPFYVLPYDKIYIE